MSEEQFMCRCCGKINYSIRELEEHYIEDTQEHKNALVSGMGAQTQKMLNETKLYHEILKLKHKLEDSNNMYIEIKFKYKYED
jgi:hypothetical protein